jgi:hypothetical protein
VSENPYAAPKVETAFAPEMATADDLRAIAGYQRWIQLVLLVQLISFLASGSPAYIEMAHWLLLPILITYWVSAIAGMVFAVLLALRVYNVFFAVIIGFFSIWPCIGLVCLLAINQRATARLQEFQIPVGLLGADMDELEKRIQQIQPYGLPPGPPAA